MLTHWAVDNFPHPCVYVCTHPSVHVLIVGNLCSHVSSDISDELRSFAVEWSGNGREGTVNLYFHTVTEGVHCFERQCANVYIKQHWSVVCYKAPDSHWIASFWNRCVLTEYFLPKVIGETYFRYLVYLAAGLCFCATVRQLLVWTTAGFKKCCLLGLTFALARQSSWHRTSWVFPTALWESLT